ncbi:family 43 glycosylhydrolase [Mucilaginibacter sp. JRF]|uniref:family 43 glycosylhydrolase n=1 Tax=Mucilaginibacter sp. JRF TaxID=2780088 RepID=UPI001882F208|nr:family 43 glycosylhydrolase [Mucilaginibacter sp. JRF]MBE9584653.1 family 43 glycosylhydrolase [Mucilaginibacter sp. JRF]
MPNKTISLLKLLFAIFILTVIIKPASAQIIKNFDSKGRQLIRFSTTGDAVDAHDGEIAYFDGQYFLYGTSYDCGFQWGNKGAPFCGFKVYSSTDMNNWTDRGYLFNAKTEVWQSRCDGKTYGCFRPHVVYNKRTKLYVLWINVYDNVVGYRVFTSKTPVGPFTEVAEPKLAVNSTMPAAGLNNGDHDTFIDDDGTAYLAYTDWRTDGTIVIEKLSDDYLTGTGEHIKAVTKGRTEAPGMFKRKGTYYIVYSDPNCGYCSGTGTSYKTAKSPLGPWSEGIKISDNSCGGQPSFVSTIKINSETVYLYGSDLWNNAAKNEALANYYWAPLSFTDDGAIKPLNCLETYAYPRPVNGKGKLIVRGSRSGSESYSLTCDIAGVKQRAQRFKAYWAGTLTRLTVIAFKNNNPDADLNLSVYKADKDGHPSGDALFTKALKDGDIGWSAKRIVVNPNIKVARNSKLVIVLSSAATTGCYGVALGDMVNLPGANPAISTDGGKSFTDDSHTLKFEAFVKAGSR